MTVDELLKQPGAWLAAGGDTGTVISSRIRLARNLKKSAFPGWAGEEECEQIWQELKPVLTTLKALSPSFSMDMAALDEVDKQILFERHLISHEHSERGRGSGLVAATCIATWRPNALAASALPSVSIATSTPILPRPSAILLCT